MTDAIGRARFIGIGLGTSAALLGAGAEAIRARELSFLAIQPWDTLGDPGVWLFGVPPVIVGLSALSYYLMKLRRLSLFSLWTAAIVYLIVSALGLAGALMSGGGLRTSVA